MRGSDLQKWGIVDPDNRQDRLPQPYALIAELLEETVLFGLGLAMYDIEQRQKDSNYEGSVKEYLGQQSLDIDNLTCLSNTTNTHNHLLAGDKSGTLYLIDLAKKVVFSKKELHNSRVLFISETLTTDGDTTFTTAAVILNRCPQIMVLRYRHGEQKLTLAHVVEVGSAEDPNSLAYSCHWEDYARLLVVYCFDGSIALFRVPEMAIDLEAINRGQTIPLEQEQFKKKLRYPFTYCHIETQPSTIKQPILRIPFTSSKKGVSSARSTPLAKTQLQLQNGEDNSLSYSLPEYRPFAYVVHGKVQMQKKKTFEKGRFVDFCQQLIYGWKGCSEFWVAELYSKQNSYCPDHTYIQHFQQRLPNPYIQQKQAQQQKTITLNNQRKLKTISPITATNLSDGPQQLYFGTGMHNGSSCIWSTTSFNVLMTTHKHDAPVTALDFFENWKVVTGSQKGSLHIDNLLTQESELKRSNVFQQTHPFHQLKVSATGLCFALDQQGNLRAYDLWRNQKVARINSCNNYSVAENKGKKWLGSPFLLPSQPLYSNHDFTVIIASHWPNYTHRQLQEDPQKQAHIQQLQANPWKSKNTSLHIIRNFDLLLTLFEGLQSTYKKGYDRRKIQNLFTNLEFPQLYDRNFEIPDFGVPNPFKKQDTRGYNMNKSQTSSQSKERFLKQSGKSFLKESGKSIVRENSKSGLKESSSGKSNFQAPLTNQILHPQKFLFERRKVGGMEVMTEQKLQSRVLQGYKRQGALENALQNTLSKGTL